jgi:DNA-binding Xre family transcriptional regulator
LAFWSVLADVFEKTVLELARTINNPPGHRVLSVGFSTLEAICRALDCQPGDLLENDASAR